LGLYDRSTLRSLKKALFAAQTLGLRFFSAPVMGLMKILIQLRDKFALKALFSIFSEVYLESLTYEFNFPIFLARINDFFIHLYISPYFSFTSSGLQFILRFSNQLGA